MRIKCLMSEQCEAADHFVRIKATGAAFGGAVW